MLDTLLQIGRIFREERRLYHHRYIKRAPVPDEKNPIAFLSIPVSADFQFDLNNITEIPENQRDKLYYLTFKTSDADGLVKYLFGDIFYGVDKKGKEIGFYRMGDASAKQKAYQKSSFWRCEEEIAFFSGKSEVIVKFREKYRQKINDIENLLKQNSNQSAVFLHFDFQGKHWYEFEKELALINEKLFQEFLAKHDYGFSLRKSLHKTIGSPEKDWQFPMFNPNALHKVRVFKDENEALDLIYAIDYSKKAIIAERNIKIVVLPRGEKLTADDIEEFFEKKASIEDKDVEQAEEVVQAIENDAEIDSIFSPVVQNVSNKITQFDFIFSKKADSPSTPDVDVIEISGIEKSLLAALSERVKNIRRPILEERNAFYPKRPKNFSTLEIRVAFRNILGDTTKGQKKYQSHLFKVLPQIYTGTYYQDEVLLPAFIEKTEFNIRNDAPNFNLLKYDYYFLTKIQNINFDRIMEMENSPSYKAGLLLGKMAKPLNYKINSFQKNYVGLLSRRIADKQGLIDFANFINEKLAIHDVAYPDLQKAAVEFSEIVSKISDKEYLKHHCAFGFFESYFKYEAKEKSDAGEQNQSSNN